MGPFSAFLNMSQAPHSVTKTLAACSAERHLPSPSDASEQPRRKNRARRHGRRSRLHPHPELFPATSASGRGAVGQRGRAAGRRAASARRRSARARRDRPVEPPAPVSHQRPWRRRSDHARVARVRAELERTEIERARALSDDGLKRMDVLGTPGMSETPIPRPDRRPCRSPAIRSPW